MGCRQLLPPAAWRPCHGVPQCSTEIFPRARDASTCLNPCAVVGGDEGSTFAAINAHSPRRNSSRWAVVTCWVFVDCAIATWASCLAAATDWFSSAFCPSNTKIPSTSDVRASRKAVTTRPGWDVALPALV